MLRLNDRASRRPRPEPRSTWGADRSTSPATDSQAARANAAGSAEDRVRQIVRDSSVRCEPRSEPEEMLPREIEALRVDVRKHRAVGQPRRRSLASISQYVFRERRRERGEIRVARQTAPAAGTPGPTEKPLPGVTCPILGIEPFGRIEQALEHAVVFQLEQDPLDAAGARAASEPSTSPRARAWRPLRASEAPVAVTGSRRPRSAIATTG